MKKCFGIVSWFPDREPDRAQRQERINRLFKQLEAFWPDIDILIITQNWKDFVPTEIKNNINCIDFKDGLGILKARQTLRDEFLKTNYDYIIMFDDDAIIKQDSPELATKFIQNIENHPKGFCFVKGNNAKKYNPYCGAQLNLCAISRFIYQQEPMINVDPQKSQGYEDMLFATLLHHKYADYEFDLPAGIYCTQFKNTKEVAPTTWGTQKGIDYRQIQTNTIKIAEFIVTHKNIPNLDLYWSEGILIYKNATEEEIKEARFRLAEQNRRYIDKNTNYYLYF